MTPPRHPQGRGVGDNPRNPFDALHVEDDADYHEEMARDPDYEPPQVPTKFYRDNSQSLVTKNTSPDLSFDASINPYRG
jgi:hypothetical protein